MAARPLLHPTRLLERLAATLTAPESNVAGLHLFTFNQLPQALAWRRTVLTAQQGFSRKMPGA